MFTSLSRVELRARTPYIKPSPRFTCPVLLIRALPNGRIMCARLSLGTSPKGPRSVPITAPAMTEVRLLFGFGMAGWTKPGREGMQDDAH